MSIKSFLSRCVGFAESSKFVSLNSTKFRKRSTLIQQEICTVDLRRDDEWINALPYDNIPGPYTAPIIGNKWRCLPFIGGFNIQKIHVVCQDMFDFFGPIVKIEKLFGDTDIVVLFDPDDIEKLFRTEGSSPDRPPQISLLYYKTVTRRDFFGDNGGIIAVNIESWSKFRPKVSKDMLQPKVAKLYVGPIEGAAQKFVERISYIKDKNGEVPGDFKNEIAKWVLESLSSVALDKQFGCLDSEPSKEAQDLINAVIAFETNMMKLELAIPFWRLIHTPTWNRFVTALDTILEITLRQIDAVMKKGVPNTNPQQWSLLQRLLATNANNPKVVVIMAFEIFLAGIETTQTAVASLLYYLSKHQDVQQKVYEDITNNLPSKDATLSASDLENMNYLKAFIREMYRFAPPLIGNGRRLTQDTVIGGYQIPKGTQILYQILISSNSQKYFENADKFLPERWLKQEPSECSYNKRNYNNSKNYHPFSTLPYGFGKRMCLGRRFADLKLQIVISKILQKYKVEYNYGELDYITAPFFTLNGELKFKFTERS